MKILVTGVAGFIGFHVAKSLLKKGYSVIGVDNLNEYYDVSLKKSRLSNLYDISKVAANEFYFYKIDLVDFNDLKNCLKKNKIDHIIHLAAQAGVRYSIENPQAYVSSNIIAFTNILEVSKMFSIKHLLYASTSSVYGASHQSPFKEEQRVDYPIQFYAATKRANELMAHSYSHLFSIPTTGLRFFTVYGPWGRPDMALFKFTKGIIEDTPIQLFNNGNHTRDFTFVSDVASSVIALIEKYPGKIKQEKLLNDQVPYRILNIGNSAPIKLMKYVELIENSLNKKAKIEKLDLQPGDIPDTNADTTLLYQLIGSRPKTDVEKGVREFVKWYVDYYKQDL